MVVVPTTPRSIELDLDGRQECELVDKFKLDDRALEDCRHPIVIHVVLDETHMEVEKELLTVLGIFLRREPKEVEEVDAGLLCRLFVAEFWDVRGE